jgi:acetyltransferase-like isoleucine patch superfamily enzyme
MKTIFELPLEEERLIGRRLATEGLTISSPRQVGKMLQFESPSRVLNASILGSVSIGAFSYLGPGCEIRNCTIGRFCSIAANVAIGPAEHPLEWVSSHPIIYDGVTYFRDSEEWQKFVGEPRRFPGNSKRTIVGNDVWIGRNVIIRQGVTVGDGAVIAGGSFINKDVPPYTIVGGVPGAALKQRFSSEVIERFLKSAWWTWEIQPKQHLIDYSNVSEFLDKFESLILNNKLHRFIPNSYTISKDGGSIILVQH